MALQEWGERDGSPQWRAAQIRGACDEAAALSGAKIGYAALPEPCELCGRPGMQIPCKLCLGFGGWSKGANDQVCAACDGRGYFSTCACAGRRAWRIGSAMCAVLVGSAAAILIWSLLSILLAEDRAAYVERARDWSMEGTAVRR